MAPYFIICFLGETAASGLVGTAGSWSTSITMSLEIWFVSSSMFFMTERVILYVFHGASLVTLSVIRLVSLMAFADIVALKLDTPRSSQTFLLKSELFSTLVLLSAIVAAAFRLL